MKRYLPLLAILALLGAFVVQAATASASPNASRPADDAFDQGRLVQIEFEDEGEEGETEEEEFELEECEAGDFEFEAEEAEEEELTEAEEEELEEDCEEAAQKRKDAPFVTAPAACRVSRAESTITALPATDQVRLTVRYRTWTPTPVTVGLKLRDSKGAVGIEHTTRHLGDRGVLHVTTKLGDSVMERALKASEFDVSLLAPGSPGYCAGDLEQQLHSVKHTSADARRVYSNRT